MADATPLVTADHISKRFLGTQALDDVSVALRPGEVHALIGENGAGKSTLIKILAGVHQPDSGTLRVSGTPSRFASPRDALAAGIVIIPQEMRIVPAQTVAENVLLGQLPSRRLGGILPMLDRRLMREQASAAMARLNLLVEPDAKVGALGFAERQLVMIARALSRDARLLILDEPTAALEAREVERLFEVIAGLKAEGVAIVYVSHRLDEVEAIGDICTVLRDGRIVHSAARGSLDQEEMIRLMTGRDLEELHRPHDRTPGAALLHAEHAATVSPDGVSLHEREVVGVAGLLGSGTSDLLLRLFGAGGDATRLSLRGGETRVATPADAIRQGIGLVPGERQQGLVMALTVRENIVLPNLDKLSNIWRLDNQAIDKLVAGLLDTLDVRPRDPNKLVRELSGGNQQKVIFARWLAQNADILLLDEPTHGIDIGAKAHIHRLMREFADGGGGILFASSEMVEVLSISDRVIAMKSGEIVARLGRDGEYTEGSLRRALGG